MAFRDSPTPPRENGGCAPGPRGVHTPQLPGGVHTPQLPPQTSCKVAAADEEELLQFIQKEGIKEVDCCFADPLGQWHHCSFHPSMITRESLTHGFPFDGSSIRLLANIEKSDMFMKPDPKSGFLDPFLGDKVLHLTCFLLNANGSPCCRCPRTIAAKCEQYVQQLGFADKACIGFEAEFFIFENVQFCVKGNKVGYHVDCKEEAYWNSDVAFLGRGNLAHRSLAGCGYCPVLPADRRHWLRSCMLACMQSLGLFAEKHHHEVGACQHELGLRFAALAAAADACMLHKYVVKNTAHAFGVSATFLPKPLPKAPGSGLHVHLSLWKNNRNIFAKAPAKPPAAAAAAAADSLSEEAKQAAAGILLHAKALAAFTNPSTNSYKRLVPGFEAPTSLTFSPANRSAAIRVPVCPGGGSESARLEFRCPDSSSCSYLCFSAIVLAAIDGIKRQLRPPETPEWDSFRVETQNGTFKDKNLPKSLNEALDALEQDHQFLLQGGVFTEDFIKDYILFKRGECQLVNSIPHPKEFELYYHC